MKEAYQVMGKIGKRHHGVLFLLVIAVLVCSMWFDSHLEPDPLKEGGELVLDSGWEIAEGEILIEKDLTLPYRIAGDLIGKTYTVFRTLPETFPNSHASLMVETSMCSLEVLIDGESIYSFSGDDTPWGKPVLGGGFSHFIRLPDWAPGHEVSLVMVFSSNNTFSGRIDAPVIGTRADQILFQLRELPSLLFGIIFLFTGIVCSITALGIRRGKERSSLWYFGWLEIALGAWVFSQNCAKVIMIRNPILPLNLSFAALYVLPYFLIQYIRSSYMVIDRKLKPFTYVSEMFLITYLVGWFGQYLGLFDYADILLVSGLALVIYIISLLIVLIIDYIRGNRELISFILAIGTLFITVLIEQLLFMMSIVLESAVLLHVGMSLCGGILLLHSTRVIAKGNRTRLHEQVLLKMAFTDPLTGVGNRTSYEGRVSDVIAKGRRSRVIGVLLFDINDLKPINDSFGHATGDQLLKDAALRITEGLPESAELYRIGGDEFVSFIPNITEEQLTLLCMTIHSQRYQVRDYQYTIACGHAFYRYHRKTDFHDIIAEADQAMYACKTFMKQQKQDDDKIVGD